MKIQSKQPRKQRKALFNFKNHNRSNLLSTRVADFVREEYGIKSLPIRVGDQVRVVKGEFKDFEGEVIEVTNDLRVQIKEVTFDKADGTQFHPTVHISKIVITKLEKEKKLDPWRAKIIDRKALYGFKEEGLISPKKGKKSEE
ncbi:MAG: 50S ribosomal protein L24 [Candidatus Lokiarchaeota archaeon]|nr:50S ribosomal protein L24 [Candidatus Lokiarchaeota archaeon]